MNTTEKQLIEKQSDYIFYLKRFISVSVNPESMVKFESEISALEQQLKEPALSAEDVLLNNAAFFQEHPFTEMYADDKKAILKCMQEYRNL